MKNFKKLMLIATMSVGAQQAIAYNKSADDAQPTHQGFGRIGTAIENTLTLHPGNAVNALATGDQSDTTYGWHKDDNNRVKANRAHTEHNNNKYEEDREAYRNEDHSRSGHKRLYKNERNNDRNRSGNNEKHENSVTYTTKSNDESTRNNKTTGHWFWKKQANNEESN